MISRELLFEASEATWPPASARRLGPWTIREGQGGGKRVSAASAEGPVSEADLARAEAAMRELGQQPLVMVREGEDDLDRLLAAAGYRVVDPVVAYACPVADLANPPPPVSAFTIWEPLQMMIELWAELGVGPERLAVMHRAAVPKTAILGRTRDRAAGVAFAAIHKKISMIHAVVVDPAQRRQKTAVNMMRAAACWAQDQGADYVAVLVTEANTAARALYASLGMQVVGNYHYRKKGAFAEAGAVDEKQQEPHGT